jgi:hypothetical protein
MTSARMSFRNVEMSQDRAYRAAADVLTTNYSNVKPLQNLP